MFKLVPIPVIIIKNNSLMPYDVKLRLQGCNCKQPVYCLPLFSKIHLHLQFSENFTEIAWNYRIYSQSVKFLILRDLNVEEKNSLYDCSVIYDLSSKYSESLRRFSEREKICQKKIVEANRWLFVADITNNYYLLH